MNTLVENENTVIRQNIKEIMDIYSTDDQKSKYKFQQIYYFKNYINFILFYIYLFLFIGLLLLFIITKKAMSMSILFRIVIMSLFLVLLITPIFSFF